MMMINPNKKAKIAKRWVSAIVALAFLFNTCCPAWAIRDGNFGEKSALSMFGSGALAGAVTAVGCLINPVAGAVSSAASDIAGVVMYYAMYHDFGKKMTIFGWETPFSKGQFYSMVSGIIAGAVAGFLEGALEAGGEGAADGAAEVIAEEGAKATTTSALEQGVAAGATAAVTEVPKTVIQKIIDAIVKALKWLWDHTIGWLWEKLKSLAKGIIKFIKHPIKTMKEWIKNLRAKPVANPYYRFGKSARYDMALAQIAGDIAIGTIKLTVSEAVQQELEEAGWDATVAAIVGNLTATYVGTFVTPIIMRGVGAPFGWKNIDNLGGLLTDEEYAKLKSIYEQQQTLQDMNEITVTYIDSSGKEKTGTISRSVLKQAELGEIDVLEIKVNGEPVDFEGGKINAVTIAKIDQMVRSYGEAFKATLAQNRGLLYMTGGLMTDIHGDPLQGNVLRAGFNAVKNLGLAPIISATTRVLILKALGYNTHYGRDDDRIFENLWKMAVANAAGNTASRLITNIDALNSEFAGLTYQTKVIDEQGNLVDKNVYVNPWKTRSSLPFGTHMLQVITQELGFAASQIGWGYFCKANDIKPGAADELIHLAGTSFAAGLIDTFARRDPGPQGDEEYSDKYLEGRLGWTDIDRFGAGVASDTYHQFIEAAKDTALLYYSYRSSGFGLNALQARWHAQDRLSYHISAIARGANPIQARAMALAGNMSYRANLNFAESFSSAITNPFLPPEYRSYAAFNYGSIVDYRVDEIIVDPLVGLLREFSQRYPEVIDKMSEEDRKEIKEALDRGTSPRTEILRRYTAAMSEDYAQDAERLNARIEMTENTNLVYETLKRYALDRNENLTLPQRLNLLAALEVGKSRAVTRTYYASRAGVPQDRMTYGNFPLANAMLGGLRQRLTVDLRREVAEGSDVIQEVKKRIPWLASGEQDTDEDIQKLMLQLHEGVYLFSPEAVLLNRAKVDRFGRLEKTDYFGLEYNWNAETLMGLPIFTGSWEHVKLDKVTEHYYGPFGHALSVTRDNTLSRDDAEWPTGGENIISSLTLYPTGEGVSPYAGPSYRIDISDIKTGPYLEAGNQYLVPSYRLLLGARAREEKEELLKVEDSIDFRNLITKEEFQELERVAEQSEEVKIAEQQGGEIDAYLRSPLGRISEVRIFKYKEFEGKISGGMSPVLDWIAIPLLSIRVGYDSDSETATARFGRIQSYAYDKKEISEEIRGEITQARESENKIYGQFLGGVLIHLVGDTALVSAGEQDPNYSTFYSFANTINLSKYKHLLDGLRDSFYSEGVGADEFIPKEKLEGEEIRTMRAYTEVRQSDVSSVSTENIVSQVITGQTGYSVPIERPEITVENLPAPEMSSSTSTQPTTLSDEQKEQIKQYYEQENEKRFIENVQIGLRQAGFYSGEINGERSSLTEEAIRIFQEANELEVTGEIENFLDDETGRILFTYVPGGILPVAINPWRDLEGQEGQPVVVFQQPSLAKQSTSNLKQRLQEAVEFGSGEYFASGAPVEARLYVFEYMPCILYRTQQGYLLQFLETGEIVDPEKEFNIQVDSGDSGEMDIMGIARAVMEPRLSQEIEGLDNRYINQYISGLVHDYGTIKLYGEGSQPENEYTVSGESGDSSSRGWHLVSAMPTLLNVNQNGRECNFKWSISVSGGERDREAGKVLGLLNLLNTSNNEVNYRALPSSRLPSSSTDSLIDESSRMETEPRSGVLDSVVGKGTEVGIGSVKEEVIDVPSNELRLDPAYLPPVQDLLSSGPESTVGRSLSVATDKEVTETTKELIDTDRSVTEEMITTLPEPVIDSTYLSTILDSLPEVTTVNLEVASNDVIGEVIDYAALPEPQTINIETAVTPLPISERELEMINTVLDLEIDTKPEETRVYDIRKIVPLEHYSELPEAVANDYMGRFIARELGYQFVSIPAGLAGNDYFETAIETVKKEHPNAVIIELHHDAQGGSNKTRLFTAHQSGENREGSTLYATQVYSADKKSPTLWAPEHLPSQLITHENTGIIEFSKLSGLLRLSPEQIKGRVNEIKVMLESKFGDQPVVIIPGHGGVNYQTSHYIRSNSGLPSIGTTITTPMPGADSSVPGAGYQQNWE